MEYQRQLHLQRLAEQEAEMQARLNQQRHFIQQREQQNQVIIKIRFSAIDKMFIDWSNNNKRTRY